MATATAKEVVRVLKKLGFREHRQVGSHLTMWRPEDGKRVTVPMHSGDIPTGTFHRILKQVGITVEEFRRLSRQ